jgi:hypothetical protein
VCPAVKQLAHGLAGAATNPHDLQQQDCRDREL